MSQRFIAKVFRTGGSQALRLPKECQVTGTEVSVTKEHDRLVIEPLNRRGWNREFLEMIAATLPTPEFPSAKAAADAGAGLRPVTYLLDTNTCIYLLNGTHPALSKKLATFDSKDIALSSVVWFELIFGAAKSSRREAVEQRLQTFGRQLEVVPFDAAASEAAAAVRSQLEAIGKPIGPFDTLIAGHAIARSSTLVTHNTREFKRVRSLHLVDWVGGA